MLESPYQKGNSNASAFLRILRNFSEHLFLQNISGGCFCNLLSWLQNHVKSQQQKNKVRFAGSLRGGMAGGSDEARSFRWFLGGFRWFVLIAGDIGWFEVVWCFSSYTIFTTYKRVIFLLYWWTHVIDWGHSIFFIQSKTARKRSLLSCGLAVWK